MSYALSVTGGAAVPATPTVATITSGPVKITPSTSTSSSSGSNTVVLTTSSSGSSSSSSSKSSSSSSSSSSGKNWESVGNSSSASKTFSDGLTNSGVSKTDAQNAVKDSSILSGLTDTLNEGTKQLSEVSTKATQAINSSLSAITSSLNSFSDLFKSNDVTKTLSTSKNDAAKGPKEADSKIKSLASDTASALANPVSFITKPVNDVIKGIDTLSQGAKITDYLSSMTTKELQNLSTSTNSLINSSSGVLGAITSVTNGLASAVSAIPNAISSMATSVLSPITSTISSFAGSLKSGISTLVNSAGSVVNSVTGAIGSVVNSVTGAVGSVVNSVIGSNSALGQLINAGGNLTSAVLGILPTNVSRYITNLGSAFIGNTLNNLVGDKLSSLSNISSLLSGSFDLNTLLNKLVGLGDSSTYKSTISNSTNNSSTSTNIINVLYKAAKTICSSISTPTSISFRLNKDLYDILNDIAAECGLSDLIKQLNNCSTKLSGSSSSRSRMLRAAAEDISTENIEPYFDERTVKVLQSKTRTVAMNGDSETYKTIQEVITAPQIKEAKLDMVVLAANMKADETSLENFDIILEKNNMQKTDLVYADAIGNENVIDGVNASAMCANNTTIVDEVLSPEIRVLTQSAMYAYA